MHIQAAKLEVRDKQQIATFSGDVRVKQGDTDMRCRILKVYYERDKDDGKTKANTVKAATPGPGGEQKIKRLEAIGNVVVTQKDQTATGKLGIFDMKSNTVTLTGDVVMTQGQNVLRGDKLVVNLTSGVSRVESGKSRQRPGRRPVHAERERFARQLAIGTAPLSGGQRALCAAGALRRARESASIRPFRGGG